MVSEVPRCQTVKTAVHHDAQLIGDSLWHVSILIYANIIKMGERIKLRRIQYNGKGPVLEHSVNDVGQYTPNDDQWTPVTPDTVAHRRPATAVA